MMAATPQDGWSAAKRPCLRALIIASGAALYLFLGRRHMNADSGDFPRRRRLTGRGSEEDKTPPFELLKLKEQVSIARTPEQLCNIVFIKTHKTASTTLKDVLFRYGWSHKKSIAKFSGEDNGGVIRLPEAAQKVVEGQASRSDIIVHHVSAEGDYLHGDFAAMRNFYQQIMQENEPMRFVTILRDAREHYISHYAYFQQPRTQVPLEEYLTDSKYTVKENLLCAEFGIYDEQSLDVFIKEFLPTFLLIMDADAMEEGLVMMARLLRWEIVDVLFYTQHLINDGTLRRWDGRPVERTPKFDTLSPKAQKKLDEVNVLDVRLNEAAAMHFAAVKAKHIGLEQDMAEYAALQKEYRLRAIAWERYQAMQHAAKPRWP